MDLFLKLDGIDGGVTQKGYERNIDVASFSWHEESEFDPISGQTGRPVVGGLNLVTTSSKASPKLALLGFTQQHIKFATLTIVTRSANGQAIKWGTFKLTDVLVSSYTFQGSDVSPSPSDRLVLGFESLEFTRYASNGDSTVKFDIRALG